MVTKNILSGHGFCSSLQHFWGVNRTAIHTALMIAIAIHVNE